MNTKICTKCGFPKNEEEFHWRNKRKKIRISRCRECASEWSKNHYLKNPNMYIRKARKWEQMQRQRIQPNIMNYFKSHPCVDCGEKDVLVLTFDHVRGKKEFTIADRIRRGVSWNHMKQEIKKCDVRCANCHARKTAQQQSWWKFATVA